MAGCLIESEGPCMEVLVLGKCDLLENEGVRIEIVAD
jgi:hypothetical protein